MQEIAKAVGLTKAGLYHHIGSKDRLLFDIMNNGMDILQETVLDRVASIQDPREKLRRTIAGHIHLIVRARDMETTVILHENRSLSGPLREKIDARKREYVHFLEKLITEVQRESHCAPAISPVLAAFSLLGMINWLYQWYRTGGPIAESDLAQVYADFFFRGLLGTEAEPGAGDLSRLMKGGAPAHGSDPRGHTR